MVQEWAVLNEETREKWRPCSTCSHLHGKPLDSGIDYCDKFKAWRWPTGPEYICHLHSPKAGIVGAMEVNWRARQYLSRCVRVLTREVESPPKKARQPRKKK